MDSLVLVATVAAMRRRLLGGTVGAVRPAGAHGLWLELRLPTGVETLLLSAAEPFPRLVLGAGPPARMRELTPLAAVARKALGGRSLSGVEQGGLDRVVTLAFGGAVPEGSLRLVAELYGRRPNLLLVEGATGRILELARHVGPEEAGGPRPGEAYASPRPPLKPDPSRLEAAALAALLRPPLDAGAEPAAALPQAVSGLTALWAREVVARAAAPTPEGLAESLAALLAEVGRGPAGPRLVRDAAGLPAAVSPVPLRHLPAERQEETASLAAAVEALADHLGAGREEERLRRELERLLRRLDERLESRREKLAGEAAECGRADLYRRMGEALVTHLRQVPRGAASVTLPDYALGPEATLTIPLDPAVPVQANAERLFADARRARRGAVQVATRLAGTEEGLARVRTFAARLGAAASPAELEALRRELEAATGLLGPRERALLAEMGAEAPRPKAPPSPARPKTPPRPRSGGGPEPRRFVSSEGLAILVGRDNQGNDHLTCHLARSEDLWLHAEGFPGSHVVVRMQGRTGGVPRRTLIEAAQLAAYYSQARSHGKVAVSYTLKKYVHKPRKSPPGLVTVSHEKSILVKPDKELIGRLAASGGEEGKTDN